MQLLPNRRGEQIKKERAGKASIRSHVTLIADFINAIDPEQTSGGNRWQFALTRATAP